VSFIGSVIAQRTVQVVAAGIISGAVVGSGLTAAGLVRLGGSQRGAPAVALVACPGSGPVLTRVSAGEALLVTARSGDGQWLEVYIDQPGLDRAWVPATSLRLQSSGDNLPVADCSPEVAVATPTAPITAIASPTSSILATVAPTPGATPTAVPNATPARTLAPGVTPPTTQKPTSSAPPTPKPTAPPTPKPTAPPTPTPKPTPTPDTTPPAFSNLKSVDSQGFALNCIGPGGTAYIDVTITDADAIANATLFVSPPGGAAYSDSMYYLGSGVWEDNISAQAGWTTGEITYHITAKDSQGVSGTIYGSTNSSSPSYLYFNAGGCIF
jgi:hypothetical protein